MSLSTTAKEKIENLLKGIVRQKLFHYTPETNYMPFHFRLLGKDRYAMFSFIYSIDEHNIWDFNLGTGFSYACK
jgi:hypothetical protein